MECLSNFNLLFLDDLRVKCFSAISFIFWKFLALFFSIDLFFDVLLFLVILHIF